MPLPTAHRVTTAHLQAAYPFMSEGGLGGRGVYIGHDLFGGAFAYDPWELYASGVLSNPNALVAGVVGKGKALALDTPIPSPTGWTSMGELQPGDQVFDELGRQVDVLAATEIMHDRPCYRVTFSDGEQIIADAHHLWVTWDRRAQKSYDHHRSPGSPPYPHNWASWTSSGASTKKYADGERSAIQAMRAAGQTAAEIAAVLDRTEDAIHQQWNRPEPDAPQRVKIAPISVTEIAATLRVGHGSNHAIPAAQPLRRSPVKLPIDPYVLGYLLADGVTRGSGRVACHPEDRKWLIEEFHRAGHEATEHADDGHFGVRGLRALWRSYGLNSGKHVPGIYLRSSVAQRLALVQGLVDSDGTVDGRGAYRFTNTARPLVDGFLELVRSLGCIPQVYTRHRMRKGVSSRESWEVVAPSDLPLARLPRKSLRAREQWGREQVTRYIVGVDPVDSVPVRCIQVAAPSGLFLAGRGCVPTHNSALVKSYILRQSVFGRRSVVLSPKPGEYDRLAQAMEAQPISLYPGGTVRLNPLDPMIAPQDATPSTIAQHRETLLVSLAEAATRRPLEPEEVTACGLALAEARPDANGVLTLPSVVDALLRPTPTAAESVAVDVETLAHDGRKAGLALRRMVTGDLRGMFDSPTTPGVSLGGPLTVIDLSRMYNSPALGIIMLCANAWQQAAVSRSDGGKWISVSEEAWATLRYTSVARAMQESYKLARSYGVQNIIVVHRLSDLEATGAAGSETRTLAQGLLEDTETRIILNQPPGEIPTAVRLLGLTEAEAALLPTLPRARALWKIADRSFLVDHRLSRDEWPIIDTDARMNVEQGRLNARSPA